MSNSGGDAKDDAKLALCASWAKRVESACENDSWGQILDAAEEYENVIKSIANSVVSTTSWKSESSGNRPSGSALKTTPPSPSDISSGDGALKWDSNETEFLKNVALCLKERVDVIQSPISKENRFPRENVSSIIGPLRNMSLKFPDSVQQCISQNEESGSSSVGGGSTFKLTGANNNVLLRMKTGKFIEMDSSANEESWGASGGGIGRGTASSDEDESSMNGKGDSANDNQSTNQTVPMQTIVAVALPGNLSPQLPKKPGETLLEIVIRNVSLKDAPKVNDGFWMVSVKDLIGLDLTPIQSTPSEGVRKGNDIVFNTSVHIQCDYLGKEECANYVVEELFTATVAYDCLVLLQAVREKLVGIDCKNFHPIETQIDCISELESSEWYCGLKLPLEKLPKGWGVFFELKYPKKQKVIALKCWALLESDEVRSGAGPPQDVVCELYKKPTDFSRKKISLLTSKQLYLHLRIIKHS